MTIEEATIENSKVTQRYVPIDSIEQDVKVTLSLAQRFRKFWGTMHHCSPACVVVEGHAAAKTNSRDLLHPCKHCVRHDLPDCCFRAKYSSFTTARHHWLVYKLGLLNHEYRTKCPYVPRPLRVSLTRDKFYPQPKSIQVYIGSVHIDSLLSR